MSISEFSGMNVKCQYCEERVLVGFRFIKLERLDGRERERSKFFCNNCYVWVSGEILGQFEQKVPDVVREQ